ncbi:hypothetical protein Tco_0952674 [Tanacetum coccineum]|uniref:Uncharacterized protein n=1 Tax=Tanacetum coccineum TaxID=301880 RepID=A0ABQ5E3M2_9ASTR
MKLCANVDSNVNIDHIQVHGQLGIAKGLIGMAVEPVERVNTHNFFGVGRPLSSDRRRQQNGTSIKTSGTEGNGFQHPLLSRPSQSGDLGSTRLSRGTSYRNLKSLSGMELSDRVYTLTGEVLKKLTLIVPSHRKFFIVELSDLARCLSSKAVQELITLRNT